jgi:dsRNA-specific ribonuclease
MNNMSTQQQQTIKSIFNSDDDIRIEKTENGNEIYVFDPYNPLNKEIQHADIENILQTYGIKVPITNINLYRRAFINKSYLRRPELENQQNNIVIVPKPDNCMPLHTKSNERLEFVGDGVLELIAKWVLYLRFPKENEGFMTEKKIALVKNEAIGKLAFEMGLHKWVVLSKHAESKDIRTNLKKLGCVFEAFLGAIFLDYNRMEVKDEGHLFENLFLSGPGFQIAQIFVESVFEKHVDWMNLIRNDDNYKNILQVKIQKEFKITPEYIEVSAQNADTGYHMGVYLCLGQPVFGLTHQQSIPCSTFANFQEIHDYMSKHSKVFIFLGEGKHKIKKKAEQIACEFAIKIISQYNPDY